MKNTTRSILIISSILAIGTWVLYFYGLNYIGKMNDSLTTIDNKISFTIKKEAAVKRLREKVFSGSKDGLDLSVFIIKSDETADLVQTLEGFGPETKTQVVIQDISTAKADGFPDGAEFLKLTLNINGSKNNVLNCVRLFESLPYNMKITDFSIARSGVGNVAVTGNVAPLAGAIGSAPESATVSPLPSTSVWQAKISLHLVKLAEATSSVSSVGQ